MNKAMTEDNLHQNYRKNLRDNSTTSIEVLRKACFMLWNYSGPNAVLYLQEEDQEHFKDACHITHAVVKHVGDLYYAYEKKFGECPDSFAVTPEDVNAQTPHCSGILATNKNLQRAVRTGFINEVRYGRFQLNNSGRIAWNTFCGNNFKYTKELSDYQNSLKDSIKGKV
jgi:hypothetical protein